MSITLNQEAVTNLQNKYSYLTNYGSSDPEEPIDPLAYVDSNGDHLIHIAAQLGDVETLSLLLDAGININQTGDMGNTALHCAYSSEQLEAVELLLKRGASTTILNKFEKIAQNQ